MGPLVGPFLLEFMMDSYENYYTQANEDEKARFRGWLRSMLLMGPVEVKFKKSDGTERVMNCTLEEGVAVPHENKTDRVKKPNPDVCPVWDLKKEQWRSFRYDSIMEINLVISSETNLSCDEEIVTVKDEQ